MLCEDRNEDPTLHWIDGGTFYGKAALLLPDDEEWKCSEFSFVIDGHLLRMAIAYLEKAVECLLRVDAAVKYILPWLVELKGCYPKVMKIWEYSDMAEPERFPIAEKLRLERDLQRRLAAGAITMETRTSMTMLR